MRRHSDRLAGPVVRFGERSAPLLRRRQRRASRRRRSAPPPRALPRTPPRQAPPPQPRVRLAVLRTASPSLARRIRAFAAPQDSLIASLERLYRRALHRHPTLAASHRARSVRTSTTARPPALGAIAPSPSPSRTTLTALPSRLAVLRTTRRRLRPGAPRRRSRRLTPLPSSSRSPDSSSAMSTHKTTRPAPTCRLRCHTISGDGLTWKHRILCLSP